MATFTIEFSVADEHMDRIRRALRRQFGPVSEVGTDAETGEQTVVTREMTTPELLARGRQFSNRARDEAHQVVQAEEAAQAARDAVTAVVVE